MSEALPTIDRRITLRLAIRHALHDVSDVEVEADPKATFGDLLTALGNHLGTEASAGQIARTGACPAPETVLVEAGLRQGDELRLVGPATSTQEDFAETRQITQPTVGLEIVGGPTSGRTFALSEGRHILGRDPDSSIAIDDPSLSRQHAQIVVEGSNVQLIDLGSRNGTSIAGHILSPNTPTAVAPGDLIGAGRTLLELRLPMKLTQSAAVEDRATGRLLFNRPPRVELSASGFEVTLPAPPAEPQKPAVPLAASLVPVVMGLVLYFVLGQATMLIFMALGPVMAIWTFVETWRGGRQNYRSRLRTFNQAVDDHERRLKTAVEETAQRTRQAAPPAGALLARARGPLPNLWEREPADADFLTVRVGSGDRRSDIPIAIAAGGSDALREEVAERLDKLAEMHAVPAVISLRDAAVLGICGPAESVDGLARFLVAQAVVLHSPRDLVLCAAVADEETWDWLKWLPHTSADMSPLSSSGLASDFSAASALFSSLRQVLADRKRSTHAPRDGKGQTRSPTILIVVDESVVEDRTQVSSILEDHGESHIMCIWLGSSRNALPLECNSIVELDASTSTLELTDVKAGATIRNISADALQYDLALQLARDLAPVRDVGAKAERRQVPRRVSLTELLQVDSVTAQWLIDRWGQVRRRTPLGATADGVFELDLRHHGPHALVGGMTDVGKSEFLRTMIASLACSLPPSRLAFVLVDYKGGAAFRDCRDLPHTVGFVTDLDEHLSQRAFISLHAELHRREEILNAYRATDLPELERKNPNAAPPALVLVIDEFATLASEVPAFVQGIVDVAQRGRSLGVHVVLATQRPAGVVTDSIRANMNLRVALRMADASDSTDVIGTTEAARIDRQLRGRAFIRTGHDELTELQTAYVSGQAKTTVRDSTVEVFDFGFAGRILPTARSGDSRVVDADTDLKRIVDAAREAFEQLGSPRQPSPWLPELKDFIPLEQLDEGLEGDGAVAVGLIDEPTLQRQRACVLDFEREGNALVIGTSGSGKTVLLRSIAAALARQASPAELNIYCLDFATRGLVGLEALPHCGAVIVSDDEERIVRLFTMLARTINRRRSLFSAVGATSLTEYRRMTSIDEPRIVVLIDGYAGFTASFETVDHGAVLMELPRLVAEGRPFGVHFVMTGDRRAAIPTSLHGTVQRRIILRAANEDEYGALGVDTKLARGAHLPPGRGFVDNQFELQCTIVGDQSGEGQTRALSALARELAATYGDVRAPAIELLPRHVDRTSLPEPHGPLEAVIGLGDAELKPVRIALTDAHFLVAGPYRSGRTTTLATIAHSLHRDDSTLELHLLAPKRTGLLSLDLWTTAASGADACSAAVAELMTRLESEPRLSAIVFVDDATELADPTTSPLGQLVKRGRDGNIRVVASVETQAMARAFNSWLQELKKDECGLLLRPQDGDGDVLSVRLPRRNSVSFPAGRGYVVQRGELEIVQVAS